FAVLLLEVRQHLFAVEPQRQLLTNLLSKRKRRRALQVIAGVHREPAATLAGERFFDVLKARCGRGQRRAAQAHGQQHRERQPHQGRTLSSLLGAAAYAGWRAASGAGQMTTTVPSASTMPPQYRKPISGFR